MAHDVANYTLSRGILSIGAWSGATPPVSLDDMGNCNSLEVEPIVEKLAHYSKRAQTKDKDKTVVLEVGYNLTFELDELAAETLNMFLMGTVSGTPDIILGLQGVSTEYEIEFVENNPEGPNKTWTFHKATIAPNGSIALLGDEWLAMSFAAEGLSDVANNATSPFFTVTYAA